MAGGLVSSRVLLTATQRQWDRLRTVWYRGCNRGRSGRNSKTDGKPGLRDNFAVAGIPGDARADGEAF